jgi:hypothetical protein
MEPPTTSGISGDLIRDVMAEGVERRFGMAKSLVESFKRDYAFLHDHPPFYNGLIRGGRMI